MLTDTVEVDKTVSSSLGDFSENGARKPALSPEAILPLLAKYRMLPQLKREMAIDQAIEAIVCTEEETNQARQQFCEQNQITSEADLQTWLSRQYLSASHLDDVATRQLKIEKFKQTTWGHTLESYFLKRKQQLDRVIYSLVRTRSWNVAQELYFRIESGEQSFAEIARQYSQGSEAETDGVIGPVELGVPHPSLAEKLITSQPGHLTAPVRLGEWVVVVRLEKLLPARLDDAMRQRLLQELFESWLREKVMNFEL